MQQEICQEWRNPVHVRRVDSSALVFESFIAEEFTRLAYTGLLGGLEHLKIVTRLIDEKFANTMGEYVT
jgi:hypothetical protein